jgi:hypothetical protein
VSDGVIGATLPFPAGHALFTPVSITRADGTTALLAQRDLLH